jgi:hypothetical protein
MIAALPEKIRGFGHVKAASVQQYQQELTAAMASYENFHAGTPQRLSA